MKKLVTVVSHIRVSHLLCCSAAVLLTACGAGTSDTAVGQPNQTAALSFDSAAGAPITGADDTTAATTIDAGAANAAEATAVTADDSATSPDGSTRLLAASTAVSAAAITHFYVATTGSDANPGTQAKPFKTIGKADTRATPGAIIHVAPGIYKVATTSTGSVGIRTTKSGTATARIKFVSDVKGAAKIVMSGTGMLWNSRGSYVDINGFDLSGTGRIGILAEGGNLTINNNFIHDFTVSGGCNGGGGGAVVTIGSLGNVVISGNVVKNIGYQWVASGSCNTVQGIYISNKNNLVTNNIVSGVAAVAIQQWHGATASTIVNNTVFKSKMGILIGQGDAGTTAAGSANNYVANNIAYDNKFYGITEAGKVGTNNRYVNNLVNANPTNWRVKGAVSGTVSANPQFVNYLANGTGNYRVKSTSPAIDKGTATLAPKIDIAGVVRPRGRATDIGAYEF
jgi:hypothetical protein